MLTRFPGLVARGLRTCTKGQSDGLGEYRTYEESISGERSGLLEGEPARPWKEATMDNGMKNRWIIAGIVGVSFLAGAAGAEEHSYNPMKWIKREPAPTASQQLARNNDMEKKLTTELQAALPPRTSLKDACTQFKGLDDCVASLHVSRNLKIKFNCLKWDVNGTKPKGDVKSCEEPARQRGMSLSRAIRELKPDADAKNEAKSAEKRAREDIKDASS